MVTKIQKWGNSQGLRISRQLLDDARIVVGDEVDVAVRDGLIVIAPARQVRGKRSLRALVEAIPNDYRAQEMDWGKPSLSVPCSNPQRPDRHRLRNGRASQID